MNIGTAPILVHGTPNKPLAATVTSARSPDEEAKMPEIERIDSPDLHPPSGYSHAVRYGNVAYIAGAASLDIDGNVVGVDDPEAQVQQTLENLKIALAAVGANLSNLVKWTVYLTDESYIPAWRRVRSRFIAEDVRPAGALLIISGLARPELIVEVEGIAIID
jgi:enamine deaminase RidA (YjgF/YER057c/UK114 family)